MLPRRLLYAMRVSKSVHVSRGPTQVGLTSGGRSRAFRISSIALRLRGACPTGPIARSSRVTRRADRTRACRGRRWRRLPELRFSHWAEAFGLIERSVGKRPQRRRVREEYPGPRDYHRTCSILRRASRRVSGTMSRRRILAWITVHREQRHTKPTTTPILRMKLSTALTPSARATETAAAQRTDRGHGGQAVVDPQHDDDRERHLVPITRRGRC